MSVKPMSEGISQGEIGSFYVSGYGLIAPYSNVVSLPPPIRQTSIKLSWGLGQLLSSAEPRFIPFPHLLGFLMTNPRGPAMFRGLLTCKMRFQLMSVTIQGG